MHRSYCLKIDRTNWLMGVSWRSFESKPNRDEIQADARQLAMPWVVHRACTETIQYGFSCPPNESEMQPARMYSAAAQLAETEQQPWYGTFELAENVWWVIAVRDGHAILPDGDQILDQEGVLALRIQHAIYGDWRYVEGNLEDLCARLVACTDQRFAIRTLYPNHRFRNGVLLFCLFIGVVGGLWWRHILLRQSVQQQILAAAAMRQQRAQQQSTQLISPLLSTPDAMTWLSSCRLSVATIPLSVKDWTLTYVACLGAQMTLIWSRGLGATVAERPQGVLTDDDTVTATVPLLAVQNGHDDAIDLQQAKILLLTALQQMNIPLHAMPTNMPVLPGQTVERVAHSASPSMAFQFESPISVFDLDLQIPGLRLHKISSAIGDAVPSWHVEGVLYGK